MAGANPPAPARFRPQRRVSLARAPPPGPPPGGRGRPLGHVSDRVHPARRELPALAGNGRAFGQSAWRHLLFGVVLGELERRLNPPGEEVPPAYETLVSPNGHGEIEHAVAAGSS